jgi:hypothetical protein
MPGGADRDAGVDPRFDPMFQRGYDPKLHRRPPRAAEPAREPRPAPESPRAEPVDRQGAPVSPETLPPPRNPYRLALLLVSIAAIAGAALLLWRRLGEEPYYGTQTGTLFVTQLLDNLPTPVLTGGIIGLCLWLAIGAVGRRDDA